MISMKRILTLAIALSSKMVEIVEKHQLEVLHVHYAIPHAYAAYMAKKMLQEKGMDILLIILRENVNCV